MVVVACLAEGSVAPGVELLVFFLDVDAVVFAELEVFDASFVAE